jgi:hypothetical protein
LVAAYFAVEKEHLPHELSDHSEDSAIYVLKKKGIKLITDSYFRTNREYAGDFFDWQEVMKIAPSHIVLQPLLNSQVQL